MNLAEAPARTLRRIALLDTSVASTNLGDRIIMEAVRRELASLIQDAFPFSVATHEWMGAKSRSLLRRSDWVIAGGTSLLSSRMWIRSTWKLSPLDALARPEIVLMGSGWRVFQGPADPYSRWLLRGVLSRTRTHSVRDSYSEKMLRSLGLPNVLNTGCPTLWSLTPGRVRRTPRHQGENVVTTLNPYMPDQERDREVLRLLARHYRAVYFWAQTDTDFAYAYELDPSLRFLDPTLEAYDDLLGSEPSLDYVGLRLHGGIRALQHARRTVIIEIDNRAKTMAADFGLPTVDQHDRAGLENRISQPFETRLNLPWKAIEEWKSRLLPAAP